MVVVVVLETVALAVMGVLVVGLLRSHAEILRRLHELGAGYAEEAGPVGATVPLGVKRVSAAAPVDSTPSDVVGTTLDGDAIALGVGRAGEQTLLLFLSSGCDRCRMFWDALRAGAHHALGGARVVAVTRGLAQESPSALRDLAVRDVITVCSDEAWERYEVPGAPFAVFVVDGAIAGRGTGRTWAELASLVSLAAADAGAMTPLRPEAVAPTEARADAELLRAGIHPGHPSLHPDAVS